MGRQFKGKQLSDNLSLSGSFSGSFQGDGSQLTGVGGGGSSDVWYDGGTYATSSKNLIITGSINVTPGTINYLTASYAISASHEIIKELSSSFADTASYVNPLNQDVIITGSLTVSGSNSIINLQEVQFDTNHSASGHSTGRIYWDDDNKTFTGDMQGSNVKLQIGQEEHVYAKNNSGVTINNGDAVRISGAQGANVTITKAVSGIQSFKVAIEQDQILGLATEQIADNQSGYITTFGSVRDLDTSAFSEGDILYLSHLTSGSYTNVRPPAPCFEARVGIVQISNPTDGVILVNRLEPTFLSDISQVTSSGVIPNEKTYLVYDDSTDLISFTNEFSGSFSGSFQGDGSGLTGVDPFPFTGDAEITGSLTVTGSLNIQGASSFESGSMTFDLTTDPNSPGADTKVNIGAGSSTSVRALKIHTNTGYLEIGPQNAAYSHFYTDRANFYFNKPIHVNGAIYGYGGDLILGRNSGTEDTITLADEKVTIKLNDTDIFIISSSHEFSGSAASTASFGTYLGDGSQLTGIDAFPFVGDAQITGSLTISGSFIPRGPGVSHISNVSIGHDAGPGLTSGGQYNVIVGSLAGNKLDDEDYNVFIGGQAARRVQYGGNVPNVIIGGLAGANLTGQLGVGANDIKGNVFIGYQAGQGGITANTMAVQNNVGIGYNALNSVSGGQNNIALGYQAGASISGGDGNIIIGSGSTGAAEMENQLRIGHADLHVISASLESGDIIFPSTASAAYFVGDGSQLTNVTGEWDGSHDGNASISGSLTLTGSLLNTGTVSIDDTDSPYTLTGTQQFVLIDPSGGDVTINMPDAATYPGREIKFKLTQAAGANTVTLQRQGSDTIDGATTYTDLDVQYESISVVSNGGTGWFIF